MGVANLIRERFLAARDYRRRQEEYRKAAAVKGAHPVPPRKDLQLEAIAEILEGKRQIHCHSYRKDEILEMMRVAEEFGVKVATFQHVLEGYKVADEIARHGAGASTFSDWWAYKFEVWDAIPYNGALMRERGVVVSFNSDSDELARRLNWEAAKAVRYGGVPPADALAFVTINPARQLGIEKRTGSLEAGKDADFVVWSGDPLSSESIALETWIEGKKYFDRAADLAGRPALEKERADLVARAKRMLEAEKKRPDEAMRVETAPTPVPHLSPPGPTPTAPPKRRTAA
jgi:imidazolonepropionase-like amidohydrolase